MEDRLGRFADVAHQSARHLGDSGPGCR
jgi:hypothetical protein